MNNKNSKLKSILIIIGAVVISSLLLSAGGSIGSLGAVIMCAVSVLFLMPVIGALMIIGAVGLGIVLIPSAFASQGLALIGVGLSLIITAFGILILYLGILMLKNVTPKVLKDISSFVNDLFSSKDRH